VKRVVATGYGGIDADTIPEVPPAHVFDGLYGSKVFVGLIPLRMFAQYLLQVDSERSLTRRSRTYVVDSVPEAIAHLEKDQNAEFYRAAELTYRGQTREFTVRDQCQTRRCEMRAAKNDSYFPARGGPTSRISPSARWTPLRLRGSKTLFLVREFRRAR
jgi:hypothetical protein